MWSQDQAELLCGGGGQRRGYLAGAVGLWAPGGNVLCLDLGGGGWGLNTCGNLSYTLKMYILDESYHSKHKGNTKWHDDNVTAPYLKAAGSRSSSWHRLLRHGPLAPGTGLVYLFLIGFQAFHIQLLGKEGAILPWSVWMAS